jgi:hypothetical protein
MIIAVYMIPLKFYTVPDRTSFVATCLLFYCVVCDTLIILLEHASEVRRYMQTVIAKR